MIAPVTLGIIFLLLYLNFRRLTDTLLVLAYGIGLTSKVLVVCIMAMPVIVLNTSGAVRNTPESLKEMGHAFLASRLEILLKIVIPAASPVIFAGLRLGVSAGFIGANFLNRLVPELREHQFVNLDKLTYAGNMDSLADVHDDQRHEFVQGDFTEHSSVINFPSEELMAVVEPVYQRLREEQTQLLGMASTEPEET